MKKFYLLVAVIACTIIGNAQIVNIPDVNFKNRLLAASPSNTTAKNLSGNFFKIDANSDGEIQVSEAQNVSYLYLCNSPYVSSVTGITAFSNLQTLNCSVSHISTLDINSMTSLTSLSCGYTQLTSLDISGLVNLQSLYCSQSLISSINVSGLTNLISLECEGNPLTSLNVSGLVSLETLKVDSNELVSLVLTGATNLNSLKCNDNNLVAIDLSGLTNLTQLQCSNNNLTSLNVNGLTSLVELGCCYNDLTSLSLSGLNDFKYLACYGNQLNSLNVAGLSTIKTLQCQDNQLTSLDISGLVNLSILDCSENQLTALDVSGSLLIADLNCSYNQIQAISVAGLTGLGTFDCSNNLISGALNIDGFTNMSSFVCAYNQLTSLTAAGSIYIGTFKCDHNNLTTLDLSDLSHLYNLYCQNNELTTLYLKNGAVEHIGSDFSNNPNLNYICADENQITQIQGKITEYGYTDCHVNSYCTFSPGGTFYTVQGTNRYDENNNGCSAADIDFPNLKLSFTSGTTTGNLICDPSGNYFYDLQQGAYVVTPVLENPTYFTVFPTAVNVSFPAQASPFQQNFCITANGSHSDLEINLISVWPGVAGFDSDFILVYKNKGTATQSGTVSLAYEDGVLDLTNAVPAVSSQGVSNLSWDFVDLHPFETRQIAVNFQLNTPMDIPPVNGGDILAYTASITSAATDETPLDNISEVNQMIVNSYDPNDKTCLEGNTVSPAMVGQYVHYVIRFENTGTFAAENIVVKDIIDTNKFDISSLIPLAASHAFTTRISDTNKAEFIFENINLPFDDANNDGYVAFKIKTNPTLVVGNTFSNTASIYFDYNFPIVTNTATTAIQLLGTPDFEFSQYFTLYPNPAKNVLNIQAKESAVIQSINIYNVLGQLVLVVANAENISSVDVSDLKPGNYFVKITSDKGSSSTKFIKE